MGTFESAAEHSSRFAPRRRRIAPALLAALALAAPASAESPAPPPEPTLEAFMHGMAGTSGVRADFREVKELGLLSVPLETRGTLHFVPPDRLARVTTEPGVSRLVIDGERFGFRDAAGGEAADLSVSPLAREFAASFIVLFNGDLEALRERYEPAFAVDGEHWTLRLRPRLRPLSDVVESIALEGSGRALARIELRETDGDRTVTTFEAVEVDRRFAPAELERIFAIPGSDGDAP